MHCAVEDNGIEIRIIFTGTIMLYKKLLITNFIAYLFTVFLIPSSAFTQAGVLEEVVVIAQKRMMSLQSTPFSVTDVTGEQLPLMERKYETN